MAGPPIATQVPARRSEDLLRLTATALVDLSRQHMPRTPVYDGTVQNAFNQLVLLCLRRGVSPPTSVPEMATWAARRPLREWPLSLTEDLESPEDCLVDPDTHAPTQQCFEWAITAVDPMAEAFENSLMNNALSLTRAAQAPQSYTAFRRLLITRPVLTGTERALLADDLHLNLMTEVIKTAYEPATAALLRDGMYAECARCHCLLVPVNDGYRCELDRCRKDGYPKACRSTPMTREASTSSAVRCGSSSPGLAWRKPTWKSRYAGSGWRWRCGRTSTPTTFASLSPAGTCGPWMSRTAPIPRCLAAPPARCALTRRTTGDSSSSPTTASGNVKRTDASSPTTDPTTWSATWNSCPTRGSPER